MSQNYTEMSDSFTTVILGYENEVNNVRGHNEFTIYKHFLSKIDSTPIFKWINNTFVCDNVKNDVKAKELRELGNKFYKNKEFNKALESYTESICYSTKDGLELPLAYANRSAVHYALEDFKNCVQDIQNSLESNYPEELKHKIYLRQANCFFKLGKREDTIHTIVKIRSLCNEKLGLAPAKIDSLLKEVVEIEKCIEMPIDRLNITSKKEEEELPELRDGKNDKFLFASAAISLKYNNEIGRHVVANRKIKIGDILFVEKPFTFVPTLIEKRENLYLNPRCYNCFKLTRSSVSCEKCATIFCGETCKNTAWEKYHIWECPGSCIDIWTSLGIGYMALRIALLGAYSGFDDSAPNSPEEHVKKYGDSEDNYKYVSKLVTNVNKIDVTTKLHNIVTAVMLTMYLKEKTEFFSHLNVALPPDKAELKVGGLILRHLLQVVANASVIEDIKEEFIEKFQTLQHLTEDGYYVRAVGIYPSLSMMNHSCDTNITFHFCDDYIVVKARREITEGEEVFNSYGYDFRKHDTEERKSNLCKQYCFECKCSACIYPTKPEIFRNGLLCQNCQGCALESAQYFKCLDCNHTFSPQNHFVYILKAETFYKKYKETGNVEYLKKCKSIREKAFYKHNYNLFSLNLTMLDYYGSKSDFENWWKHAQISMEMDEIFMGKDCLQHAVNLRKTVNVILPYLSSLNSSEVNDITKTDLLNVISRTRKMITEMQKLFRLFYSKNILNFDEIQNRWDDMIAVVTHILKKNLLKQDENEMYEEMYADYMYSVI